MWEEESLFVRNLLIAICCICFLIYVIPLAVGIMSLELYKPQKMQDGVVFRLSREGFFSQSTPSLPTH